MNELYELIEQKIKASGYRERFQVRQYTMIFVIRLMEKRMACIFCYQNLRKM